MKDELIDRMNKEMGHQKFIVAVSAFAFVGLVFLAALFILHTKHPHLVSLMNVPMIKSFFRILG